MRTRTVVAIIALTAAAFTAGAVHGVTTYDTPDPLYRCAQSWVNNTDHPCVTYTMSDTGTAIPITLNPGDTYTP